MENCNKSRIGCFLDLRGARGTLLFVELHGPYKGFFFFEKAGRVFDWDVGSTLEDESSSPKEKIKIKKQNLEILERRKSQHVWVHVNTVHASTPQLLIASISFIKRGEGFRSFGTCEQTRMGRFFLFFYGVGVNKYSFQYLFYL